MTTLLPAPTLDSALADWLLAREADPTLPPSAFAARLPEPLRAPFRRDLEDLAAIDELAAAAPCELPRHLRGYRILGRLGEGATGVVYEAEQVALGRRVAVKMLHPAVAGHTPTRARFAREARLAAALRHPSIVSVLDFGDHDGQPFLVMRLANGVGLHVLLTALRQPSHPQHAMASALLRDPRRLAATFAGIADALAFAHARSVVHRDLKPSNLVLDGDGHPTVLDFGLARSQDPAAMALTQRGDLLGTPLYMAPEQLAGDAVGPAADVWALGCVLYECLTGRPANGPFAVDCASLPRGLADLVQRCLQRDPTARPTAATVAGRLRRLAARPRLPGADLFAATHALTRRAWPVLVAVLLTWLPRLVPSSGGDADPGALQHRLLQVEKRLAELEDFATPCAATRAP